MSNVIKGTSVDFEKVSSLDGTYIINRYNKNDENTFLKPKRSEIREFEEDDIIAEEVKKERLIGPRGGSQNEGKK
jgi:hypothetical protein